MSDSSKQSGLVCVSLMPGEVAEAIAAARSLSALADVFEVRLDGMRNPFPSAMGRWLAGLGRPVLATNRPLWEGGRFAGAEEERVALLHQALSAGAAYVDLELDTAPELRCGLAGAAARSEARLILSRHDFAGTPENGRLEGILAEMMSCEGVYAGKIVTTARNPEEALRILALQQKALAAGFPLSAFAMGAAGRITRLATLHLGGFMTYAAQDAASATAPGQLPVHALRALQGILEGSDA